MRLVHKEVRLTLLEVCISHVSHFASTIVMLGLLSGMMLGVFRARVSLAVMCSVMGVAVDELLRLVVVLLSSDQPTMFFLTQVAFALLACERYFSFFMPKEDHQNYR